MKLIPERILKKVNKTSTCWMWIGLKNKRGYGYTYYNGGMRRVHRLFYELLVGETNGLQVLHKCDTPLCVNPDHLWLGTNLQNRLDSKQKGRTSHKTGAKGEAHHAAKLTRKQVEKIRKSKESGVVLADKYKVSRSMVSKIRLNHFWK